MAPWELYARGPYWQGLALSFERADQRAQAIADKIAEARCKGAKGDEEDEGDEDEE